MDRPEVGLAGARFSCFSFPSSFFSVYRLRIALINQDIITMPNQHGQTKRMIKDNANHRHSLASYQQMFRDWEFICSAVA